MCIKSDRTILKGNMVSVNNEYYIPINNDGTDFIFYKGTTVEVWKDVFNWNVKIFKNNKIYNTRKVEGHRIDMNKKEQKRIDDQKQLEILIRERDERLKARAKRSWVHFNPCFLAFIYYNNFSNKVYLYLLST